jgi:Na+-translocating ferredoxin:NAD+ oxidoreductase RnfC subunit
MEKNKKIQKKEEQKLIGARFEEDQPYVMPGIRRFQFFTNVDDRALTINLNRAAMFGIAAMLAIDVGKAVVNKNPQTIYCYECRACYGTQDKCPVGIAFQAELVVAARVTDYNRFLRNGGLKCIRCGNCQSFCVQYLNLPQIFGTMQLQTMEALREGKIPKSMVNNAFEKGLINQAFINEVAQFLKA